MQSDLEDHSQTKDATQQLNGLFDGSFSTRGFACTSERDVRWSTELCIKMMGHAGLSLVMCSDLQGSGEAENVLCLYLLSVIQNIMILPWKWVKLQHTGSDVHGTAMFVKPQQWPTPSESFAIYCV